MNVILVPNPYRDKQFRYTLQAKEVLEEIGANVSVCLPFQTDRVFDVPDGLVFEDVQNKLDRCDILVCLGGDGTILHASKLAADKEIPILGINIGTLGFMAELEASEISMLKMLCEGKYSIEERMMLEVQVSSYGKKVYTEHALNDAVVTKGAVARVLQMRVCCNDAEVLSFSGDGVILGTPTGSTAYSLSAGGPVVEPTAKNILITPICAHGQNSGCFVTEPTRTISVSVDKIGRRNAFLSVDGGRAYRLESTDIVTVTKSDRVTKLIRLKGQDFFRKVNRKFCNR